jgi:hypothetical protein
MSYTVTTTSPRRLTNRYETLEEALIGFGMLRAMVAEDIRHRLTIHLGSLPKRGELADSEYIIAHLDGEDPVGGAVLWIKRSDN